MAGLAENGAAEDGGGPNPVVEWLYLNQFKLKLFLVDALLIALGFAIAVFYSNDLANVIAAMLIWFGLLFAVTGVVLWAYISYRAWRSDR